MLWSWWRNAFKKNFTRLYFEINEKVTEFFLSGDKFMLKMHLRPPEFIYGFCVPFTKNKKKRI